MSWRDWFRRPEPQDEDEGDTYVQTCMTPASHEHPKLPRRWDIVEGHGERIGQAIEQSDRGRIRVHWDGDFPNGSRPVRTLWVDIAAFREEMDGGQGTVPYSHGLTLPIRLHWVSRGDNLEDHIESGGMDW